MFEDESGEPVGGPGLGAERPKATATLGTWMAEGCNPTRVFASREALRLLDIDAPSLDGKTRTLLERIRLEGLAHLHNDAIRHRSRGVVDREIGILLRNGDNRLLLARIIRAPDSAEGRSLGILLDITEGGAHSRHSP